jgi:predicted acetyltransferase
MTAAPNIVLDAATPADATLLANLLELYIHDLSAAFPDVTLGSDGRFGYRRLPLYWTEPDRRFAFLIRADDQLAGFILATRGSPAADDPNVLDVAEFFVLRRYRRTGVGRRAATLLWSRLPGQWTVRVLETNTDGLAFWREVVGEAAAARATEAPSFDGKRNWRVFTFESGSRSP